MKSAKLEHVLYDVRGPVVDEAAAMEEKGLKILKLNIGNPAPFGFRAPDEVIYDMRQQLTECEGYSDSRGLFSARKAIMQYATAWAFGKRYLIFLQEPIYQSGTPAATISSSAPSGNPLPFRTASMILKDRFSGIPQEIR